MIEARSAWRSAPRSISLTRVPGTMRGVRRGPRREDEPLGAPIVGVASRTAASGSTTGVVGGRGRVLAMGGKDSSGLAALRGG